MKQPTMPELSESMEQEKLRAGNGIVEEDEEEEDTKLEDQKKDNDLTNNNNNDSEPPSPGSDSAVLPSIPNSFLRKLGLSTDSQNTDSG